MVSQGDVPPDLARRVVSAPVCGTIAELCGLVAHAAMIVATDTAIAHLADAWSVKCHVAFTTHRPEWRVRDYPHCSATLLPVQGLPQALEFIRGEDDLRAIAAGWRDGATMLESDVARFAAQ